MEQPGPASDTYTMEESEVESVSTQPHLVNNCTSNIEEEEEEEQISHNGADEKEKYSQANNVAQPERELIKTATAVQADTETESEAQKCSQEHLDTDCTESTEDGIPLHSVETGEALVPPVTTLDDVIESSPSVLDGKIETLLTFDEDNDSHVTNPDRNGQPSVLVPGCSTAPSPADDSGSAETTSSSDPNASKHSTSDSITTSGFSNSPSTPSSDTVSSSLASSPQTRTNTSAPLHTLSSPYDTDCSRKLISQIQRSLSQESLLDELESELLACQLPGSENGGERKGSPPVNGLATDQEGCMVVFEKCVQYKYAQQEKAIQR